MTGCKALLICVAEGCRLCSTVDFVRPALKTKKEGSPFSTAAQVEPSVRRRSNELSTLWGQAVQH